MDEQSCYVKHVLLFLLIVWYHQKRELGIVSVNIMVFDIKVINLPFKSSKIGRSLLYFSSTAWQKTVVSTKSLLKNNICLRSWVSGHCKASSNITGMVTDDIFFSRRHWNRRRIQFLSWSFSLFVPSLHTGKVTFATKMPADWISLTGLNWTSWIKKK